MRFVGNLQFGVYLGLAFQTGTELFLILKRIAVLFLGVRKLLFRLLQLSVKDLLRNVLVQITVPDVDLGIFVALAYSVDGIRRRWV